MKAETILLLSGFAQAARVPYRQHLSLAERQYGCPSGQIPNTNPAGPSCIPGPDSTRSTQSSSSTSTSSTHSSMSTSGLVPSPSISRNSSSESSTSRPYGSSSSTPGPSPPVSSSSRSYSLISSTPVSSSSHPNVVSSSGAISSSSRPTSSSSYPSGPSSSSAPPYGHQSSTSSQIWSSSSSMPSSRSYHLSSLHSASSSPVVSVRPSPSAITVVQSPPLVSIHSHISSSMSIGPTASSSSSSQIPSITASSSSIPIPGSPHPLSSCVSWVQESPSHSICVPTIASDVTQATVTVDCPGSCSRSSSGPKVSRDSIQKRHQQPLISTIGTCTLSKSVTAPSYPEGTDIPTSTAAAYFYATVDPTDPCVPIATSVPLNQFNAYIAKQPKDQYEPMLSIENTTAPINGIPSTDSTYEQSWLVDFLANEVTKSEFVCKTANDVFFPTAQPPQCGHSMTDLLTYVMSKLPSDTNHGDLIVMTEFLKDDARGFCLGDQYNPTEYIDSTKFGMNHHTSWATSKGILEQQEAGLEQILYGIETIRPNNTLQSLNQVHFRIHQAFTEIDTALTGAPANGWKFAGPNEKSLNLAQKYMTWASNNIPKRVNRCSSHYKDLANAILTNLDVVAFQLSAYKGGKEGSFNNIDDAKAASETISRLQNKIAKNNIHYGGKHGSSWWDIGFTLAVPPTKRAAETEVFSRSASACLS